MFCSEAAVAGAGRVALSVLFLETVLTSVPSCGTARCSTWLVNNINSALLTKNHNHRVVCDFLQQNLNSEFLSNLNYFLQLPEVKKSHV